MSGFKLGKGRGMTPAELRSLRKQEAALKKQLRALRVQNSN